MAGVTLDGKGGGRLQSLLDELMRLREDLPAQQADELRNILAASPDLLEFWGADSGIAGQASCRATKLARRVGRIGRSCCSCEGVAGTRINYG